MKLCCISDTHLKYKDVIIPECDVLLHAGDLTAHGKENELIEALAWYNDQPAKHLLYIGGNHDWCLENNPHFVDAIATKYLKIQYLHERSLTVEGFKFYGSNFQPEFCAWAFNLPRNGEELQQVWARIPDDTEILLTHTPMHGILDRSNSFSVKYPQHAGCSLLLDRAKQLDKLVLALSGHIHESRGIDYRKLPGVVCVNACICDRSYQPVNKPILIELNKGTDNWKVLDF